jgi:hypothetical protein
MRERYVTDIMACPALCVYPEKLYREKIVRPGVTRLERLVATARDQAHVETFRRLTPLLTEERKIFLDGLLTPDLPSRWREIRTCNDNVCGESKRQNSMTGSRTPPS